MRLRFIPPGGGCGNGFSLRLADWPSQPAALLGPNAKCTAGPLPSPASWWLRERAYGPATLGRRPASPAGRWSGAFVTELVPPLLPSAATSTSNKTAGLGTPRSSERPESDLGHGVVRSSRHSGPAPELKDGPAVTFAAQGSFSKRGSFETLQGNKFTLSCIILRGSGWDTNRNWRLPLASDHRRKIQGP